MQASYKCERKANVEKKSESLFTSHVSIRRRKKKLTEAEKHKSGRQKFLIVGIKHTNLNSDLLQALKRSPLIALGSVERGRISASVVR